MTLTRATAIKNVEKRTIRIVYDIYIVTEYFYLYESLFASPVFIAEAVCKKVVQSFFFFLILPKVVCGNVNSMNLVQSIYF